MFGLYGKLLHPANPTLPKRVAGYLAFRAALRRKKTKNLPPETGLESPDLLRGLTSHLGNKSLGGEATAEESAALV